MEVPRLGVELELPAYTIAMPDLSHVCDLHHSSRQHQILNPPIKARDWTCILMDLVRFVSAEPRWELFTQAFQKAILIDRGHGIGPIALSPSSCIHTVCQPWDEHQGARDEWGGHRPVGSLTDGSSTEQLSAPENYVCGSRWTEARAAKAQRCTLTNASSRKVAEQRLKTSAV